MKSGGEEKVMTFSLPMTRSNICFCIPKHGVFVKNPNINHFSSKNALLFHGNWFILQSYIRHSESLAK